MTQEIRKLIEQEADKCSTSTQMFYGFCKGATFLMDYLEKQGWVSEKDGLYEMPKEERPLQRLMQDRVPHDELKRVFYVDTFRAYLKSFDKGEMSFSRLVEILNEDAHNFYIQPERTLIDGIEKALEMLDRRSTMPGMGPVELVLKDAINQFKSK